MSKDTNTKAAYWLVWNRMGQPPSFRHSTELSARVEAERLARAHPGERFEVLAYIATAVRPNEVAWSDNWEREVPF